MVLSNSQITKVLIRLRGSTGWSVPLMLRTPRGRFSRTKSLYKGLIYNVAVLSLLAGMMVYIGQVFFLTHDLHAGARF